MFVNKLEKTLLEANQRLFRAAKMPLRSHGPDHHWRTYQNALTLAGRLNVSFDSEILAGATLLHDLAAYYPEKTGQNYHDFDDKIAREVLHEIDFPNNKISAAVECIAHHGSDPKYKKVNERIETTLLRDGDKLEAFGPIGVARIVMVRTLNGDTMAEIVDDFWTRGHLKRKWEAVTTSEAREMGRENYEYSCVFFQRLSEALTESG